MLQNCIELAYRQRQNKDKQTENPSDSNKK